MLLNSMGEVLLCPFVLQLPLTARQCSQSTRRILRQPSPSSRRFPSQEEFAARIETVQQEYPWIVWEEDGKILGYAYAHKFAERISYRPSAELSVYLDRAARGKASGKSSTGRFLP